MIRRIGYAAIPVLAAALTAANGSADFRASRFEFVRAVQAPATATNVWAIELDEHAYAHTAADFADLRIVDAAGKVVPHVLRVGRERRVLRRETPVPSRIVSLIPNPATNALTVVVKTTTEGAAVTALDIGTPWRDFERRVEVSGSADGDIWTTLAAGQSIVDYARFIDVRSTRVTLPSSTFRFYRVTIDDVIDGTPPPLRRMVRDTLTGEAAREFESTAFNRRGFPVGTVELTGPRDAVTELAAVCRRFEARHVDIRRVSRSTVIACDGGGLPLTGLAFTVGDRNFSRRATVRGLALGASGAMEPVGDGVLSRIAFGGAIRERLELDVAGGARRWQRLELALDDRDGAPLDVQRVDLVAESRRLVFQARAGGGYRLYYGCEAAAKPASDVVGAPEGVEFAETDLCRLGAAEVNPDYVRGDRPMIVDRALLGLLGAVVALLLAWLAACAVRKARIRDAGA